MPDGDRHPLLNAQRLPDHRGLLRRWKMVEPGNVLLVAVLGDGVELGQIRPDRRPMPD
jgi:hypothetical protein